MSDFIEELKRRRVFRVIAAYAVIGWIAVQIASDVFPILLMPDWTARAVVIIVIAGFPVVILLTWLFDITPDGIKRTTETDKSAASSAFLSRRIDFVIIGALLVALSYFIYDKHLQKPDKSFAEITGKSIAVLPFVDLSPERDQEYFSDGIAEELLNVLAKTDGLRVAARTSSFAFRGRNENIQTIGEELNVATVLEGSVRKAGTQLRITAQLINTADGYHLWSETYDRQLDDIFAIQDEISGAIAGALKTHLGVEMTVEPVQHMASMEAYNLYLQGRYHFTQRRRDELEKALSFFQQAIAEDPDYAPAYVGLADSYMLLRNTTSAYGTIPSEEAMAKARPLIEMALALDPGLAEAHASLGLLLSEQFQLADAEAELRRAIELNPNLANAHLWLANLLGGIGKDEESLEMLERTLEIDPFSIPANGNYAGQMLARGKTGEARVRYQKLITLNPANPSGYLGMGNVALTAGQYVEAARWIKKALELAPSSPGARQGLGSVYLTLGMTRKAAEYLYEVRDILFTIEGRYEEAAAIYQKRFEDQPNSQPVNLALAAFVETYSGNYQKARDFLEPLAEITSGGASLLFLIDVNQPAAVILAALRQKTGDEAAAQEMLAEIRTFIENQAAIGINTYGSDYMRAAVAALDGKTDEAITHLKTAYDKGFITPWLDRDIALESLRGEPGFQELQQKMQNTIAAQRALLEAEESEDR